MAWNFLKRALASLATIIATVVITALLSGDQLKGMPILRRLWAALWQTSAPLWLLLLCLLLLVLAAQELLPRLLKREGSHPKLHIVPRHPGQQKWGIGAIGKVPAMSIMASLSFAHEKPDFAYILQTGYIEGTKPAMPLIPDIVVSGPNNRRALVHLIVQPIKGKSGKPLMGRLVFVDQFGQKHRTEKIAFQPMRYPIESRGPSSQTNCLLCNKPLEPQDWMPESGFPAHAECIRQSELKI